MKTYYAADMNGARGDREGEGCGGGSDDNGVSRGKGESKDVPS